MRKINNFYFNETDRDILERSRLLKIHTPNFIDTKDKFVFVVDDDNFNEFLTLDYLSDSFDDTLCFINKDEGMISNGFSEIEEDKKEIVKEILDMEFCDGLEMNALLFESHNHINDILKNIVNNYNDNSDESIEVIFESYEQKKLFCEELSKNREAYELFIEDAKSSLEYDYCYGDIEIENSDLEFKLN